MPPADKRLGADDRFVRQPHLRLEVKFELVMLEGMTELQLQTAPGMRLGAQHRLEEAAYAAALRFGLIKGEIGVGDQFIDAGAIDRRDGNPGASANMDNLVVDYEEVA